MRTGGARFDAIAIFFHWLTVVLIAVLVATGFGAVAGAGTPFMPPLLLVHRSSGAAVWGVTLLRLLWRRTFARFPTFPDDISQIRRVWVQVSERAFYLLLLLQPMSGLLTTLLLGRPFAIFSVTIPALLPRDLALWQMLFVFHRAGAIALLGLAGLHAAVVLTQHYVFRSNILRAMAPL